MKRFFTLTFLGVVMAGLLAAQTDLQPVAIVRLTRSEPITVKQLKTEVEKMEKQAGRTLTATEREQVLDVMINEKLAIQAAERDRITVSDNELNQQIQQLRTNMAQAAGRQPTEAEFATAVRNETGLDMNAFREQIRRQYLVQKYLMSKKQNVLESARPPTEADIVNFYNNAKSQFVRPETVRVSMILVPFGANAADRTKARELANRLVQEIGSNAAKFDAAAERAQAPGSGYQSGATYLPRTPQAQQSLGQELLNVAFNLRQGEISRLVESPQGYHILKVTETYEVKILNLDDVIEPGSRVTVRNYITQGLSQQRQQEVIDRAQKELVDELRRGNNFQVYRNNLNW
ncbi:peptidylprolyl isomerase [Spirochaetia bacterium]|nr:peptidylprolyl isomerase [Spirochaetia bacterium]